MERFLKAYIEAIHVIKKNRAFVAQVIKKWHKETDLVFIRKTVDVYALIFNGIPYVSDRGLEVVLRELSLRRPIPKELLNNPSQFRDHAPLEKLVKDGWIAPGIRGGGLK